MAGARFGKRRLWVEYVSGKDDDPEFKRALVRDSPTESGLHSALEGHVLRTIRELSRSMVDWSRPCIRSIVSRSTNAGQVKVQV